MKTSKFSMKKTKAPCALDSSTRVVLSRRQVKNKEACACPHCGNSVSIEFSPVVSHTSDPVSEEKLMDGTFFEVSCPHCGKAFEAVYSVIYVNERNNRAVELILPEDMPESAQPEFSKAARASVRRMVKDENELREKVTIFQRNLDDRAIEVMKIIVKMEGQKRYRKKIEKIYFIIGNEAYFHAILENGKIKKALCYRDTYEQIKSSRFMSSMDASEEAVVDEAWAEAYLEQYS